LEEGVTSIDQGENYRDDRVKAALIHPARIQDRTKKFGLNTTCDGDFFKVEAGREVDKFDHLLVKYYTNRERGTLRPNKDENGQSIPTPRIENKWAPNNFATKLIENLYTETPRLLDRSNTPRGAQRAITLDRNFSNKKWLYNKSTRDHFDPNQTKIELDRSKKLRRLTRK